jgi:hypothetical protein
VVSRVVIEAVGIEAASAAVARCCAVESLGRPTREQVMAAIHTLQRPGSTALHDRMGKGGASALLLEAVEQVLADERAAHPYHHRHMGGGRGGAKRPDATATRLEEADPPSPRQPAEQSAAGATRSAASDAIDSVDRTLEEIERELSLSPVAERGSDEWQLPRGAEWELSSSSSGGSDHGDGLSNRLPDVMEVDERDEHEASDDAERPSGLERARADDELEAAGEPPPPSKQLRRARTAPDAGVEEVPPRSDLDGGVHASDAQGGGSGSGSDSSRRKRSLRLVARSPDERPDLSSYDPEPEPAGQPPPGAAGAAANGFGLEEVGETDVSRRLDHMHEPASPSGALARAARVGDVEEVMELLRQGADVNGEDNGGWTALQWAALEDMASVTEVLVSGGQANFEKRDRHGRTALITAAISGSANVVQVLLENGARWEIVDNGGKSAIDWADGTGEAAQLLRAWAAEQSTTSKRSDSSGGSKRPGGGQTAGSDEPEATARAVAARGSAAVSRRSNTMAAGVVAPAGRGGSGSFAPCSCYVIVAFAIAVLLLGIRIGAAMTADGGHQDGQGLGRATANEPIGTGGAAAGASSVPLPRGPFSNWQQQSSCMRRLGGSLSGKDDGATIALQLWRCLRDAENEHRADSIGGWW